MNLYDLLEDYFIDGADTVSTLIATKLTAKGHCRKIRTTVILQKLNK